MSGSDFWGDQERARQVMDELRKLKSVTTPLKDLASSGDDLQVLMEFAEDDASGDSLSELKAAADRLALEVDKVELQTTMSRPEDASNAYVTIQAGEGGTDSAEIGRAHV